MNFTPSSLLESAKCFRCIPPGMANSVVTSLLCQWANKEPVPPVTCIDPQIPIWLAAIASDPLAIPPTTEQQQVVCEFCQALRIAGIFDKMVAVNVVLPGAGGIRTMAFPVMWPFALTPWTNSNFVDGDLTVDGLRGANNKWFNPHISAIMYFADNDMGLSVYVSDPSSALQLFERELGAWESDLPSSVWLSANETWGGGCPTAWCWDDIGALNFPFVAERDGFYTMNRVGVLDIRYRFTDTPGGGIPALVNLGNDFVSDQTGYTPTEHRDIYFMAFNNDGIADSFSYKRVSFAAIHHGLTEQEMADLHDAVYDLRVGLGGGYV